MSTTEDLTALLEHSFQIALDHDNGLTRLSYLSDHIFDFTTYDGGIAELFASKALEVCAAISNRTTFDYIRDAENYRWYLIMVNMPFFAPRLEWGTSIRGAWWEHKDQNLETCGIWRGDEKVVSMGFTVDSWPQFIAAMQEFAALNAVGIKPHTPAEQWTEQELAAIKAQGAPPLVFNEIKKRDAP